VVVLQLFAYRRNVSNGSAIAVTEEQIRQIVEIALRDYQATHDMRTSVGLVLQTAIQRPGSGSKVLRVIIDKGARLG